MRLDERVDPVKIVDACCVFEIGAVGILMALAEAHQRLVRPGIVVKHRDLDDPQAVLLGKNDVERIPGRLGATGRPVIGVESACASSAAALLTGRFPIDGYAGQLLAQPADAIKNVITLS